MTQTLRYLAILVASATLAGSTALGQTDFGGANAFSGGFDFGNAPAGKTDGKIPSLFDSLSGVPSLGESASVDLSAGYRLAPDERTGILTVAATIPPQHHIYSMTQPKRAIGVKSTLTLLSRDVVELDGRGFVASPSPHLSELPGQTVPSEEHTGRVEWSVPFRIADGVEPRSLAISLQYDGQVCSDPDENGEGGSCIPISGEQVTATFEGMLTRAPQFVSALGAAESESGISLAKPYRAPDSPAQIAIGISPRVVQPGGTLTLTVAADTDDEWHVYALQATDPKEVSKPTLIVLDDPRPWMTREPTPSVEPVVKKSTSPTVPDVGVHDQVVWTWTWTVPEDAEPGLLPIVGYVGYHTCRNETCLRPLGIKFSAQVAIGDPAPAGVSEEIAVEETTYTAVAKLAAARAEGATVNAGEGSASGAGTGGASGGGALNLESISPVGASATPMALWQALALALVGGFILNFMPCVLPVLGLKVYSFVEMSGESRARVFWLNIAYSLGLLSVFWILATLAVTVQLGWGQLFASTGFLLAMIGIVFAMALSFLGLWEIPIPGFAGASPINKLAEKENWLGSFFKGVLATILATPCSGPGLAAALTQIVKREWWEVYAIFTFLGIGMAVPYLLIALEPRLLAAILPKPGAWMNVFKQGLAFFLLFTVAWLIFALDFEYMAPAVVFVFGIWLACWIVGVGQHHAFSGKRMIASWGIAGLLIVAFWFVSFTDTFRGFSGVRGVVAHKYEMGIDSAIAKRNQPPRMIQETGEEESEFVLDWQPFSMTKLEQLTSQEKTVLVDFTADWCWTCKTLEGTVLNTKTVKRSVENAGVETLVADWTKAPPEITLLLEKLTGSRQIPVVAIFPAVRPNQPIVLTGGYTMDTLLKRLEEAGPSAKIEGDEPVVAMRETVEAR